MRKITLILATATLAACGQSQDSGITSLEDEKQTASYAIGYRTGEQMEGRADDLHLEAFIAGLRAGATGDSNPLIAEDEMDDALMAYQQQQYEKMQSEMASRGADNRKAGDQFRAENAERGEVTTLESGLQYEVLASGDGGPNPTIDDTVRAHYHGTLVYGSVFDSSVERDEPAVFPLAHVIEGWQEALQMMSVGDKWRIVIPPEMAYGDQEAGGRIPPGSTLIFDVELLEIGAED
jgi:FKBP-type peptidyl-prolyl cis-trans isomerase FklB